MADEPQRQGRASQEKAQRRRRSDSGLGAVKRLPIPPEVQARLDAEGLVPRWVNDEGNRMHRFTVLDDYDKVADVEPVPVGRNEAGEPILAHLLAKPRSFINEDREKADAKLRETEAALFRTPDAAAQAGAGANPNNPTVRAGANTFVDPASKIGRGNQILE